MERLITQKGGGSVLQRLLILSRSRHLPNASTEGSLTKHLNKTGVRLWTARKSQRAALAIGGAAARHPRRTPLLGASPVQNVQSSRPGFREFAGIFIAHTPRPETTARPRSLPRPEHCMRFARRGTPLADGDTSIVDRQSDCLRCTGQRAQVHHHTLGPEKWALAAPADDLTVLVNSPCLAKVGPGQCAQHRQLAAIPHHREWREGGNIAEARNLCALVDRQGVANGATRQSTRDRSSCRPPTRNRGIHLRRYPPGRPLLRGRSPPVRC